MSEREVIKLPRHLAVLAEHQPQTHDLSCRAPDCKWRPATSGPHIGTFAQQFAGHIAEELKKAGFAIVGQCGCDTDELSHLDSCRYFAANQAAWLAGNAARRQDQERTPPPSYTGHTADYWQEGWDEAEGQIIRQSKEGHEHKA